MNLLKTFETRVGDAFGAAPQGYTAPFSFKKLAKRATREMENETFEIDGINTAPALYTILVSAADDAAMRPLYTQLTAEIVAFVEAQAQSKGYIFVGKPLARFMVDPSLRSGKFAVFAENVDAGTLSRLRAEEDAFLSSSVGLGGAAGQLRPDDGAPERKPRRARSPHRAPAEPAIEVLPPEPASAPAVSEPAPVNRDIVDGLLHEEFAPVVEPVADASAGLKVIPTDFVQPDDIPAAPQAEAIPVPQTQRRNVPLVSRDRNLSNAQEAATDVPTCLLVNHQTGRTYTGIAPATVIGRERTPHGIVLHDPNVSRHHAELSFDGRTWHITDLNSTNGTLVNDAEVSSCALADGDLITLGLVNLEFRENQS
ncbi:FhaA domain-containing protein [Parafannyhessea umbonata]|uniref:FhaA domain-containing protein n=1 Tax=Parafannyhessea umbonata TaxID=604330 RepID=UPI003F9BB5A3